MYKNLLQNTDDILQLERTKAHEFGRLIAPESSCFFGGWNVRIRTYSSTITVRIVHGKMYEYLGQITDDIVQLERTKAHEFRRLIVHESRSLFVR